MSANTFRTEMSLLATVASAAFGIVGDPHDAVLCLLVAAVWWPQS